ncbi:MAG: FAD-dependent oxidoreductase [Planctomycetota bacterium]
MAKSKKISFSKTIHVRHTCDVLVAGGGTAGAAAAIVAARQGAKVLLVERMGCLGGLGTSGLVPGFCPMWDGTNLLADGVNREVVERLHAQGGVGPDVKPNQWSGVTFDAEVLKRVLDDMVVESGVTLRFATEMVDVVMKGQTIAAVVLCGREGLYAVEAKVFVDGTGDGMLSVLAGAPWELGDEKGNTQGMTLCSILSGVDWDAYMKFLGETKQGHALHDTLERAIADGFFTQPDRHLPGVRRSARTFIGGNISHVYGRNAVDDEQLTESYILGRKLAKEYLDFYRKYVKGFESAELATTAALMGIRETRRIMGDYVLNIADFKARASFPDEIGRYNYPIDIHRSSTDEEDYRKFWKEFTEEMRLKKGESYGIPYRSLIPKDVENLLVAGRCISTDRKMQGSIRVMPGCFITGQAAGMAAALCAAKGRRPRDVDANHLRDNLRGMGAYLP